MWIVGRMMVHRDWGIYGGVGALAAVTGGGIEEECTRWVHIRVPESWKEQKKNRCDSYV